MFICGTHCLKEAIFLFLNNFFIDFFVYNDWFGKKWEEFCMKKETTFLYAKNCHFEDKILRSIDALVTASSAVLMNRLLWFKDAVSIERLSFWKNREVRVGKFHDFSIEDVIFRAENAKERCSSTANSKKQKERCPLTKTLFYQKSKRKRTPIVWSAFSFALTY